MLVREVFRLLTTRKPGGRFDAIDVALVCLGAALAFLVMVFQSPLIAAVSALFHFLGL